MPLTKHLATIAPVMAGLKSSTGIDRGRSKSAGNPKKNRSNEKASALSAEYIVDSDSDAPMKNSSSPPKAQTNSKLSGQVVTQPSIPKRPSDSTSKPALPTKRKHADSNDKTPSAHKKIRKSSPSEQELKEIRFSDVGSIKSGPTESRQLLPTHPGKKVATPGTNVPIKTKATTNVNTRPEIGPNGTTASGSQAKSAHRDEADDDSSSEDEEIEAEGERTAKLPNQLAVLKNGATSLTPRRPLESLKPTPKGSSQLTKHPDSDASSNSSANDDSSSEGDEEESESGPESEPDQSSKNAALRLPPIAKSSAAPAIKYKPPPGFSPASATTVSTSEFAAIFSQSNLASKQIWHFALPASIPVSAIKSVSMDSIMRGASAFTYKDTDFAFMSDTSHKQAPMHLLIPNEEGSEYKAAPKAIARTLHLQQVLRLPDLSKAQSQKQKRHNSSQATEGADTNGHLATTIPPQMVAHEQPQGLKMRYMPFGDESNAPINAGSDSDEEGATKRTNVDHTGFRMPTGYRAVSPEALHEVDNAGSSQIERPEPPAKKRKKHRKEREGTDQALVASPSREHSSAAKPNLQVNNHGRRPSEAISTNGVLQKHDGETAEEKAQRRAEKDRKKQERRKKRAEAESASSQLAATQ